MNVFILCTGRSGSTSLIKACAPITNYSSGHETLSRKYGQERLSYPDNHIEGDNRLSWFLARLDKRFGKEAFYVHLIRDKEACIQSFMSRWDYQGSILKAYAQGILLQGHKSLSGIEREAIVADYYDTVNSNIELFLENKPYKMTIHLEEIQTGFSGLFSKIAAEGDLDACLSILKSPQNTSQDSRPNLINRIKNKLS